MAGIMNISTPPPCVHTVARPILHSLPPYLFSSMVAQKYKELDDHQTLAASANLVWIILILASIYKPSLTQTDLIQLKGSKPISKNAAN